MRRRRGTGKKSLSRSSFLFSLSSSSSCFGGQQAGEKGDVTFLLCFRRSLPSKKEEREGEDSPHPNLH